MIIVGLTGGIASGKSLVAKFLANQGAIIIDADQIAHQVVKKGMPAWKEIIETFGRDILKPDDELDRKALGKIVFSDKDKRDQLNHIVHPRVFEEISYAISAIMTSLGNPNPVIILDIPLLFETSMHRELSDIIVVYAPVETQLTRLKARDNIDQGEAMARIQSQIPIEEKIRQADYVIDNSESIDATRKQVEVLIHHLKQKAGNKINK